MLAQWGIWFSHSLFSVVTSFLKTEPAKLSESYHEQSGKHASVLELFVHFGSKSLTLSKMLHRECGRVMGKKDWPREVCAILLLSEGGASWPFQKMSHLLTTPIGCSKSPF